MGSRGSSTCVQVVEQVAPSPANRCVTGGGAHLRAGESEVERLHWEERRNNGGFLAEKSKKKVRVGAAPPENRWVSR
jgi:hypothetical protein